MQANVPLLDRYRSTSQMAGYSFRNMNPPRHHQEATPTGPGLRHLHSTVVVSDFCRACARPSAQLAGNFINHVHVKCHRQAPIYDLTTARSVSEPDSRPPRGSGSEDPLWSPLFHSPPPVALLPLLNSLGVSPFPITQGEHVLDSPVRVLQKI